MWIYQGLEVIELPEDCVGFVYIIVNKSTGRMYIGKKLAKFTKTTYKTIMQKNGVKKKKKIRSKIDSDWRTYWSSSDDVKKDVELLGEEQFTREILMFCLTKGTCSYFEAKYQMLNEVLEYPDKWYNGQIQCRVHRSHIKK